MSYRDYPDFDENYRDEFDRDESEYFGVCSCGAETVNFSPMCEPCRLSFEQNCIACESGDHGSIISELCFTVMRCACECHKFSKNRLESLTSAEIIGTLESELRKEPK